MNLIALFRTAAIGSFVLPWVGGGVDSIPGVVPESLFEAVEATLKPGHRFLIAVSSLVFGAIALLATVGLVLFQPWARPLALALTVVSLPLYPFIPAMVQSGWGALFLYLSTLAWGATLAMAYFSPLSVRFAKAS